MPSQDDIAQTLTSLGKGNNSLKFGQGTILNWDPDTFQNEIEWRGTTLVNIPVLAGADALTFQRGDQIGLIGTDPSAKSGAGTWSIIGRLVVPGTGRGTEAVEFLTTQLATAISVEVFANRVRSESISNTIFRDAAGFGDPTGGSAPVEPGPDVIVDVSESGTAIVFLTSWIEAALGASSGSQTGIVGVEVFSITGGAAVVDPEILNSKYLRFRGSSEPWDVTDRSTSVVQITGLNEGRYRFHMTYSSADSQQREDVVFAERNITVIGL